LFLLIIPAKLLDRIGRGLIDLINHNPWTCHDARIQFLPKTAINFEASEWALAINRFKYLGRNHNP